MRSVKIAKIFVIVFLFIGIAGLCVAPFAHGQTAGKPAKDYAVEVAAQYYDGDDYAVFVREADRITVSDGNGREAFVVEFYGNDGKRSYFVVVEYAAESKGNITERDIYDIDVVLVGAEDYEKRLT